MYFRFRRVSWMHGPELMVNRHTIPRQPSGIGIRLLFYGITDSVQ
ncbi:hypothetical protein Hdeb2414_s0003g00094951 [Helianthus debilis subsp. tardiflorus]